MSYPLMIFAAGKGTRMAPLTDTRPKPLIEVGGQALLDRALDHGRHAGCAPIVVNAHYLADQIAAHLGGSDVTISREDTLLETGGGLRRALPLLGGDTVMTLNPDVVFTGGNPLKTLINGWRPDEMDALLLQVPETRAVGRIGAGDFSMYGAGRLTRKGDLIFAGATICNPASLADIGEEIFSLNVMWDRLIARGRAFGVLHDGSWADVGRPDCIPLAEELLARA